MTSTFADKSGRGVLFAALQKAAVANGYELAPSDIVIGGVEESTNPARESQVGYQATPDSQYEGDAVAYYNRLDLQALFVSAGVDTVQIPADGVESLEQVVSVLNQRYSTGFTAEDIATGGAFEVDGGFVQLQAQASSLGFKGALSVQLVEGVDPKIPLAEVIVDPVLGDLTYPVDVPVYLTEPVIVEGTISEKGQKENGTMLNGTANPSTDFTMVNNGEIELGLAARVWKSAITVPPVNNHYTLSIADEGGDWNWPIHISLLQEERPITDLYDVTLSAMSIESEQVLEFQLIRTEDGVLHFINEPNQLDIEDNVTTPAGDVTQNIQRVTFYKDYMGEMTQNATGAPVGEFIIELNATRREGLVPTLKCSISVDVTIAE